MSSTRFLTTVFVLLGGFTVNSVQAGPSRLAPLTDGDFRQAPSLEKVELGRLLFFDKELSGNRNISCASCHHAMADTGDGLSLSIGEGARGMGKTRDCGSGADAVPERVPRNSPAVFNLGAKQFGALFWDGRVANDDSEPSGFLSPAGADLPLGLDSVLAAQAMFPVTSGTEMAGQAGENSIADAAAAGILAGPGGVWEQLGDRLQLIPGYVDRFVAVFDDVSAAADISYVHAANAIAAFEETAWRADDSPFDRSLRGDHQALSPMARRGMHLFYGRAGCSSCHAGVLQTDQGYHSVGLPQVGPGKGDGFDGHDDYGRERVTGDPADRFRFRTPSLRNVELTGPWGHDGAYDSLEVMLRHHLDPGLAIEAYDTEQLVLPPRPDLQGLDLIAHSDGDRRQAIADSSELPRQDLREADVDALLAFLRALTDPASVDLRSDIPWSVPSGLSLAE